MIEILVVILLCSRNAKNAAARGRKAGGFIALTLLLWFGGELVGFFLGGAIGLEVLPAYGVALVFAIAGAITAYLLAKNAKPGDYVPPAAQGLHGVQPLSAAANITLVRDKSAVGAMVNYTFTLNGQPVGELKNGARLGASTNQAQNMLVGRDMYGNTTAPFYFSVAPGGMAEIHFSGGKFQPAKCTGCTLMDSAQVARYAPPAGALPAGVPPVAGAPVQQGGATAAGAAAQQPIRAVWLSAVALACLPLFAFTYPLGPLYATASQLHFLCFILVLAAGVYLLMQQTMYKILGGVFMLVGAPLYAFTSQYLSQFSMMYQRPPLAALFADSRLVFSLGAAFFSVLLVGGISLLFALLQKGPLRQKLFLAGWVSSAALAVQYLFNMRNLFFYAEMPLFRKLLFVLNNFVGAASVGLLVILIYFLCSVAAKKISVGVWARVWIGLCVFVSLASIIGQIATGQANVPVVLIALAWVAGYILLFCNQRIGFPLALICIALSILASLKSGLMGSYGASAVIVLSALFGALNPVITWLLIRKSWMQPQVAGVAANAAPAANIQPLAPVAPQTPVVRQMYSYLATVGFLIDPQSERGKVYANQIHPFAVRQMQQMSPIFAQKYDEAVRKSLPHKIGFGTAASKEGLNPAFKKWIVQQGVSAEDLNSRLNKTLFMKSGQVPDPVTGEDRDWCVYICFLEE